MALYQEFLDVSGDFISYEDFHKNFRLKKPERFNFAFDVADRLALETPDAPALVWTNTADEEKRMTFAELRLLSDRAANMFRAMGVCKGDAVMLILKRHYEFWIAIMALHKLGAVTVPATHLLTRKDLVYRFNAANVRAVVSTGEGDVAAHVDEAMADAPCVRTRVMVRGARAGWLDFHACMAQAPQAFERPLGAEATRNEDTMLLYFTSGTTGMPKMVTHDFLYPLAHIVTAVYWQQVAEGGLHLTISDTGWAKSVWGKLYGQWLGGSAVFVYDFDKFVARDILKKIADYGVTTLCAPPTMYRLLLQEDFARYDLSRLTHCVVAGEPLNPEIYNDFLSRTGIAMREAFGQTELTVALCTFPWLEVKPGSMGKPSPMFDVDLLSEDGRPCAPGESGEIVVRTHHGAPVGMFQGYYRDEAMTRGVWHDAVYHTGDLAWRDEWGYYWYVGRMDDVIKSAGYRIGPFEVESALLEHEAVLETAITAVPDEIRGQVVKATVVLKPGFAPSEELKRALQDHVKRATAPYKYPRIIEFVAELPKTISGKIRRVALREKDAQGEASNT